MVKMHPLIALFISLFIVQTALYANEHYLIPEQKSDLIHTLKRKIERAHSLSIITSQLESATLDRSIQKLLKNEGNFVLITTSKTTAAYYAKYKNTSIYLPKERRPLSTFKIHILLIDHSDVCISSVAFSNEQLQKEHAIVICTTAQEEVDFATHLKKLYQERFTDYHNP